MDERINHGTAAIMQPYIFPYVGYFHLIEASDVFVFYDDVTYIKQGWVNRNRILFQGEPKTFSIPISNTSSNTFIMDTQTCINDKWLKKFYGVIQQAYKKAPFYQSVLGLLHEVTDPKNASVSDLAIHSISSVYAYLGESYNFKKSSEFSPDTQGLDRAERLCVITKRLGHHAYANASGGKSLYDKPQFKQLDVDLSFVSSSEVEYTQFENPFVPWLSIIDVLMFNSEEATKEMFKEYTIA